jgi:hypothetical protein
MMTDKQQRMHWILAHLADALLILLVIGVLLLLGGKL